MSEMWWLETVDSGPGSGQQYILIPNQGSCGVQLGMFSDHKSRVLTGKKDKQWMFWLGDESGLN